MKKLIDFVLHRLHNKRLSPSPLTQEVFEQVGEIMSYVREIEKQKEYPRTFYSFLGITIHGPWGMRNTLFLSVSQENVKIILSSLIHNYQSCGDGDLKSDLYEENPEKRFGEMLANIEGVHEYMTMDKEGNIYLERRGYEENLMLEYEVYKHYFSKYVFWAYKQVKNEYDTL